MRRPHWVRSFAQHTPGRPSERAYERTVNTIPTLRNLDVTCYCVMRNLNVTIDRRWSVAVYTIDYYEEANGKQPAEVFEDDLSKRQPKLLGKLLRAIDALEEHGRALGGGLLEPCHSYPGLWELRVIFSQTLARELLGFDGTRAILLHGYVKRAGEEASDKDLERAAKYWSDYQRTHRISPEQPE